jgi:hypothetical protein
VTVVHPIRVVTVLVLGGVIQVIRVGAERRARGGVWIVGPSRRGSVSTEIWVVYGHGGKKPRT